MAAKLSPDAPFNEAGAGYMREQNDRITKHLSGTLEGGDPEELHDMRVASRRLRAAMLVFERCFDPPLFRRWYRRVSRLTEALGAVRDMDVQMEAVAKRREGLSSEEQADIDAWVAAHAARRDEARAQMARAIKAWRDRGRGKALDRVLMDMEAPARVRGLLAGALSRLREGG